MLVILLFCRSAFFVTVTFPCKKIISSYLLCALSHLRKHLAQKKGNLLFWVVVISIGRDRVKYVCQVQTIDF